MSRVFRATATTDWHQKEGYELGIDLLIDPRFPVDEIEVGTPTKRVASIDQIHDYDLVFLDTPGRSESNATSNRFAIDERVRDPISLADVIILCSEPTFPALKSTAGGLKNVIDAKKEEAPVYLLPTKVDARMSLGRDLERRYQAFEELGVPVLEHPIHYRASFAALFETGVQGIAKVDQGRVRDLLLEICAKVNGVAV